MAQDASSFLDDSAEKSPSASSFLGEESAADFLGSPSPYSPEGIASSKQALVQSAAKLAASREAAQEPQYRIGIKAPFGLSDRPILSAPIPAELAAFGAEAAKSVVPTGAGLAAASAVSPYSEAAGAALRLVPGYGKLLSPVVKYGAPLLVGGGAAMLSRYGEDQILPRVLPEDAARSYELTGQLAAESPTAAMLGQFAGAGPFMRPGLPINTTGGARIAVPAIAGTIGGGIEGANQLASGDFDAQRLAAATLGSAFLNRETRLGQRIAPNLVLPNIGTELMPAELAGTGQMMRDAPLVPTDVIPSELDAMNQAGAITRAEQGAARASGERAVANAEAAGTNAKAQALAERMAGKTPQEQLSILDQEMQLQKDTLTEAEQRAGLDMKILLKQQIDQQKALEKAAADQQRAQADATKAAEAAAEPPKSEQILNEAAKPPAIANVAAEIGTQTSPFALQGKLNELTAAPTPVADSVPLAPKVIPETKATGIGPASETPFARDVMSIIHEDPEVIPAPIQAALEAMPKNLRSSLEKEIGLQKGRTEAFNLLDEDAIKELGAHKPSPDFKKAVEWLNAYKAPAPATFVGIQEGIPGKIADIELYNLTQDIPGHPTGSTVSRQTLEKAGFAVPEKPAKVASTVSDGSGVPTAKEKTMLKEQQKEVERYLGQVTRYEGNVEPSSVPTDVIGKSEAKIGVPQKIYDQDARVDGGEKVTLQMILDEAADDRAHGDESLALAAKDLLKSARKTKDALEMRRVLSLSEQDAIRADLERRAKEYESDLDAIDIDLPEQKQLPAPRPTTAELRLNDAGLDLPPISGMSREAKRAELDAAGIKTYNGKPLDDANPAEISNAVGKLRRGQLGSERGSILVPGGKKQTETPEFKAWFGDSQVVDESGKPKVVYHGTPSAGFSTFDTYAGKYGLMGSGGYFTESPSVASSYTSKGKTGIIRRGGTPQEAVYPVHLKIDNALDMDIAADAAKWREAFPDYGAGVTDGMTNEQAFREVEEAMMGEFPPIPDYEGPEIIQSGIREMGYDGITHIGGGRVKTDGEKHRVWIAFDPTQIKSAIGNRGTFNPNDPDIRAFTTPTVAGGVAGSGAGAVGGFVLTDREPGESEEEFQARRLRNAAIGAGIGAAGGAGIGALQRGAKKNPLINKQVSDELAAKLKGKTPEEQKQILGEFLNATNTPAKKGVDVFGGKRVALPETEAGEGIRQTAAKVIENREYPERLRATLANDPDIVYDKFALSDLADRVSGASIQELTDMRGSPSIRERLGATAELANRYSLSPDPVLQERGAALYSELAQSLTSPAQMLGLGKLVKTPQGYVAAINETLKNVGRTLSKPQADALNKLAVESIRTEQELARATRLAEEDFSEVNEAAYRNAQKANGAAKKNLDDFVHQVAPEGWDDLISKVIQGNLLTPLSLVANVFGNAVYQPVRRASSALASAMDEIYSAARGKPRVTSRLNPLPGIGELKAAGEGIKVAAKELLTGPGVDSYVKSEVQRGFRPLRSITQAFTGENLAVQPDGTVALNDRAKKLFEGLAGVAPEAMFRVLNLGDKPFRRAAEAEILLEQARLRGLKGRDLTKFLEFPDESTQELLNTEGRRAIMAQENKGVTKLNQFLDSGMAEMLRLDQIPAAKGALKILGRIIVPFRQFPVNYVLTALNFAAPELAFSKAIYHGSKGDRRKALQNIGEGALGVMMYGGANYLWDKGLISEPTDKDAKSRTTQYEQMGPQRINVSGLNRALEGGDPSYKLGDLTMDWGRLGIPASVFYVFTKDASQGRKETARTGENHKSSYNPASLVGDRLAAYPGMASFSLDQSWLSGTASFLEALRNPDPEGQEMQNWTANAFRAASSVAVPNSVEALAKAHYQYIPELKGDNLTETLKNTWNFKVMQLPEGDKAILKRDLWGQPISRTQPGENPYINQFVDVTRAERKQPDPFKQSLIKLYQQTESPDVYPALPTRVISQMGITAKLDPQDYEDLQAFTGNARRQFAETVMANPKMADPSVLPELKILALQEAYTEGAKLGKMQLLQKPGVLQKYFPELVGGKPATEGSRTVARDPEARARLRLLTPVAEPLPTR